MDPVPAIDCEQTDALLAARLDGALPAADEVALAVHLAACAGCATLAESLGPEVARDVPAPVFPVVAPDIYELGDVIGHGGMGRIRRARDLRVGRHVAIKELLFATPVMTARFVREARVAAQLQHPNIVPIYDVGSWADGTPFYVMRLVDGRSLWEALALAESPADRLALLPAVIAVADALSFAHRRGVVHRDLAPANILLGDHGETIVIDWGLAKDLRVFSGTRSESLHIGVARVAPRFQTGLTQRMLTAAGDVVGSPAYMPREQAAGLPIDERADIYAVGAILYHLLVGRPPYVGRSSNDVIAQVRRDPPAPIRTLMPEAPPALVEIAERAMARDADDRFDSARELAGELRQLQARVLLAAHRPSLGSRVARWFGARTSTSMG